MVYALRKQHHRKIVQFTIQYLAFHKDKSFALHFEGEGLFSKNLSRFSVFRKVSVNFPSLIRLQVQ